MKPSKRNLTNAQHRAERWSSGKPPLSKYGRKLADMRATVERTTRQPTVGLSFLSPR